MDDENEVISLASMFLDLRFAGAADVFLRGSNPNNISPQLKTRCVTNVRVAFPFAGEARLEIGDDDKFRILVEEVSSPDERAFQLGHELARTFHFNLTTRPPESYLSETLRDGVEEFYDEFARRWVARVSLKALTEWFEQEFSIERYLSSHAHVW